MRWMEKLNRWLSGLEWRWSLGAFVWGALFPTGSFVLPAWGAKVAGVFSAYAPLSWIAAGFIGLFSYAVCVALYGYGQVRMVRARYDERFFIQSGGVDPLAKVFEGKRIFLNDFVLPSNPVVDGKTFVDCEIVGPANIFLQVGNSINNVPPVKVDAIALDGVTPFLNGFVFRNCTFRGCTFHRISLFFLPSEARQNAGLDWLNWISAPPPQSELPGFEPPSQIEDKSGEASDDQPQKSATDEEN